MEPTQGFGSLEEYKNFVPSKRAQTGKYLGDIMKGKRNGKNYFLKTRKAKANETKETVKAELMPEKIEFRHPSILNVWQVFEDRSKNGKQIRVLTDRYQELLFERIRKVSFARRLAWLIQIAEGFQFLQKKKKVVKTFTLVIQDMNAKIADLDTIGWENTMLFQQIDQRYAPEPLQQKQKGSALAFTKETNIWSLGMNFLSALLDQVDGRPTTHKEILKASSEQGISLKYIQFTNLRDLLLQMINEAKEKRPNIEEVCRRLRQLQDWEIRVLSIQSKKNSIQVNDLKSVYTCNRYLGGDQVILKILKSKDQKQCIEELLYRQKFNPKATPQSRKGLQHIVSIQGAYCKIIPNFFQTKIVMEKCQKSILEFIDEFTSFSCVIDLMLEITEGLCFLQEKFKVAHLDVKPENILIKDGKVKIIDFDISVVLSDAWSQTSYKLGTKGYTAPEIHLVGFSGHGFSTDVWSLGITFAHILYPQEISKQPDEWPEQPGNEESFPSMKHLEKIKIIQIRNLITRMLVRDPEKRIVMREVQQKLQDIRSLISENSEGLKWNISKQDQKAQDQKIKVLLFQQLDSFQDIFRQICLQQAKNSLNQFRMSNDLPQQQSKQAKQYSKFISRLLSTQYPNQATPTIIQSFLSDPKQIYSLEQFINKILAKITSLQLTLAPPIAHDDPALKFADLVQPYVPALDDYHYNQITKLFQFKPTHTANSSYINNTVILAAMSTVKIKQIKNVEVSELKNYLMALARRKKVIDNLKRQSNRGVK